MGRRWQNTPDKGNVQCTGHGWERECSALRWRGHDVREDRSDQAKFGICSKYDGKYWTIIRRVTSFYVLLSMNFLDVIENQQWGQETGGFCFQLY